MSRTKEHVYNSFASELAQIIRDKATHEEDQQLLNRLVNLQNRLFNVYVKTQQKMLEKVPVGYLTKKTYFPITIPKAPKKDDEDDGHRYYNLDSRTVHFDMKPDEYFMPDVLTLSAADRADVGDFIEQRNDLNKRKIALHEELTANIIAADSIDQIKEGWPEVADHVEELATQYGVKFQTSLPKILGRHLKAVAAATAKKQLK